MIPLLIGIFLFYQSSTERKNIQFPFFENELTLTVKIWHTFTLLPPLEGKKSTPSHILLGLSDSSVASPAGLKSKGLAMLSHWDCQVIWVSKCVISHLSG